MLYADIQEYSHEGHAGIFISQVELTADSGEITCLFGPSGVGKTSLLRVLIDPAERLREGEVTYSSNGVVLDRKQACEAGMIGLLLPDAHLVPWTTVSENLLLPARLNPHLPSPTESAIAATLAALNLSDSVLNKLPFQLSFGMRHRLLVARTLLYKPKFLFLDEVFNALDSQNADDLCALLKQYVRDSSCTCIIVTHDVDRASQIATSVIYMNSDRKLVPVNADAALRSNLLRFLRQDLEKMSNNS